MNGYLFTANISCAQVRPEKVRGGTADRLQIWSTCVSSVVCADSADAAQKLFETGLLTQPDGENPKETKIYEIISAPLVAELLTERGATPLDWPHIVRQTPIDIQAVPPDFMEQGNWLDQDSIDNIKSTSFNLDSFCQTLPEDLRSSLSWAEDKQFYFFFRVLAPLPAEPITEPETEFAVDDDVAAVGETNEAGFGRFLDAEPRRKLPCLATAVLIRARNSAVAVWLWRKYAANTRFRENSIRLEPWCGVLGVDGEMSPDEN